MFLLQNVKCYHVSQTECPNESVNIFLQRFSELYDISFPEISMEIKSKSLMNPWFTKGLQKSSKRKQKLYEKFLKNRTLQNEKTYKNYKNLFEKVKKVL